MKYGRYQRPAEEGQEPQVVVLPAEEPDVEKYERKGFKLLLLGPADAPGVGPDIVPNKYPPSPKGKGKFNL